MRSVDTSGDTEVGESAIRRDRQYTQLRLGLLASKRDAIVRLRDEGRIDDIVLREIQRRLDVEEVRLSGTETGD
jgi:hypothetical protein